MSYILIACTVLLTVYGQLVLKWQVTSVPQVATQGLTPRNLLLLLSNPWVISAFIAAFGASLFWMLALSRMPLSKAYPFTTLSLPIVAVTASLLFREQLDTAKILGTLLIMCGVLVLSRSGV